MIRNITGVFYGYFYRRFVHEKINVNLKDGECVENIPAKFENGKAVFQLPSGKILNEHDLIVRILDDNNFEQYMVLDKGYTVGVDGEVFFAAKIKRIDNDCDSSSRNSQEQKIVINAGSNNNIAIHSHDITTNVNQIQNLEVFFQLEAIFKGVQNNQKILEKIEAMKNTTNDSNLFRTNYQDFIQSLANHSTIISTVLPLLPALSKFLG